MVTYVVGFGEERTRDFYLSLQQLLAYDPDQIQLLYMTPHKWTPFFEEIKDKEVVQVDQEKWDYKHQGWDETPKAVESDPVCQADRGDHATTTERVEKTVPSPGCKAAGRHALVHKHRSQGLVP